jgi:hypothetical protein
LAAVRLSNQPHLKGVGPKKVIESAGVSPAKSSSWTPRDSRAWMGFLIGKSTDHQLAIIISSRETVGTSGRSYGGLRLRPRVTDLERLTWTS